MSYIHIKAFNRITRDECLFFTPQYGEPKVRRPEEDASFQFTLLGRNSSPPFSNR